MICFHMFSSDISFIIEYHKRSKVKFKLFEVKCINFKFLIIVILKIGKILNSL